MLAALSLLLGYLETFVPIPIPGVRLGLANVAVLIALGTRDLAGAVGVAAIKVAAGALLFGSPVTLAYSAVGTTLALAVMVPLSRLPTMRMTMTSVVGAVAHEAGQLLVASVLLGTASVWLAAPLLLVAAIVTGALCGAVASATLRAIDEPDPAIDAWARHLWDASDESKAHTWAGHGHKAAHVNPTIALIVFAAVTVALLRATGAMLAAWVAAALAACTATQVGAPRLARALRPLVGIAVIAAVAQLLASPEGRVVARIGPLAVSDVALAATLALVGRLVGITAASLVVAQVTRADDVACGLARAVRVLGSWGIRAAGPGIALAVALRLAPTLVDAVGTGGSAGGGGVGAGGADVSVRNAPRIIAALYRTAGDAVTDGHDATGATDA